MKKLDRILAKCKKKTFQNFQPEGYTVRWSDKNIVLFEKLIDTYFKELIKELYIKVDGRQKEPIRGTDDNENISK